MFNLETLEIKSKNSVDDKSLVENIKTNYSIINNWIKPCFPHDKKALIVSAGPSTKICKDKIIKARDDGYEIFCIKHSLPMLLEMGVVPTGVFILDPRTIKGYSTHGQVRKDLYKDVPDSVIFFVASMTAPDVTQHLINEGKKVVGWNALVTGLQEYLQENNIKTLIFNYGTSSSTRAIGVMSVLGFKHVELVGFDSCIQGTPTEQQQIEVCVEGPPKYSMIIDPTDGAQFWSTGELLAQVQDIKTLTKMYKNTYEHFEMWDDVDSVGYRAYLTTLKQINDVKENATFGIDRVTYEDMIDQFKDINNETTVFINTKGKTYQVKDPLFIKGLMKDLNIS